MLLSEFLVQHSDRIVTEWVAFAQSILPGAKPADLAMLRDDVGKILKNIARDLKTSQTPREQVEKSKGRRDANPEGPENAAQSHGSGRARSGFTLAEMVSEYRALRASVIRLWTQFCGELGREDLDDLMRFNEAIDQALAESTQRFMGDIDQSREVFLAILGHDLRAPLGGVIGAAKVMESTQGMPVAALKLTSIVLNSGNRMNKLVDDLLDFTRSQLGKGIPIIRTNVDIVKVCRQTIDEIAAAHSKRFLKFDAPCEFHGTWDSARIAQALSNVIQNAIQYGSEDTPITISLTDTNEEVVISVHNSGPEIPPDQLPLIFEPLRRGDPDKTGAANANLGLGLYIAERIVEGHQGTLSVESSAEKGTTFTMQLPTRGLR